MNAEVANLFPNGSRWVRADFHLHTPADREFEKPAADDSFPDAYAQALGKTGVELGVITNHNKFDQDEFKLLRKAALKKGIFLLPGVELSVQGGATGVHLLVVFDPATWIFNTQNEPWINKFLDKAFDQVANRESENTACGWTVSQLLDQLDNCQQNGRDSFVIAAHVDRNKGLLKEMGAGIKSHYGELFRQFVLGFQLVQENGSWNNLGQWLGDNWRPACVEGSDPKALDQVGRAHLESGLEKKCWLKLGDFNFQAVRLALLMKEHRVTNTLPKSTGARLEAVHFQGGLLDGQTLRLNADMNNLIGIRGSGKSSVLECIRYALDHRLRETEDADYKEGLVSRTLGSGGKITLELVTAEGHAYTIQRIFGESPKVFRGRELVPGLRPEGVLKSRYFGQKDLAKFSEQRFARELVERFSSGARTAPAKTETFIHQIEQKLVRLTQDAQRLSVVAEVEAKLAELKETLRKFDDGVQKKLAAQVALDKDVAHVRDLLTHGEDAVAALRQWAEEYGATAEELAGIPVASPLDAKVRAVRAAFEKFCAGYGKLREALQFLEAQLGTTITAADELFRHQETNKEAFAEIRRSLNLSGELSADTFVRLTNEKNRQETKQTELKNLKQKEVEVRRSLENDLAALQQEWQASFQQMKTEVRQLNESSPGLVIRLSYRGDKGAFIDHLAGLVSGLQRRTLEKLASMFADGIELYRDAFGECTRLKDEVGLKAEQLAKIKEALGGRLNQLLTWRVPDAVAIELNGKPLHEHSIGQRATALMLFLLTRREFDVLIVDQPEDDLDNQTLFTEVIRRLLELKGQRQLIFSTHSPNIPVLGDAEQVIRCQYSPGRMAVVSGSIDRPQIQGEIVAVMEGGEEALRRRNQIYALWTQ